MIEATHEYAVALLVISAIVLMGVAGLLLVAAIAGTVLSVAVSALPLIGTRESVLIGLSMVPRAEIALIIMGYGHALGSCVVPDALLSAMVLASLATATLTPLILGPLLAQEASRGLARS